jgi:hypothetical protein
MDEWHCALSFSADASGVSSASYAKSTQPYSVPATAYLHPGSSRLLFMVAA